MNLRTRIRRWLRQRRRRRAANKRQAPLREFVYLDEVSVYSLIASRLGPVAVEFTDTETASLQTELSSSIGANVGITKAAIDSRAQTSQSQTSQVLRKSIVQTTFRELYEIEKDRLLLRPAEAADVAPVVRTGEDLRKRLSDADPPWLIASEGLARGELLELEVELETEPIFRVSTVVSTLFEIMRESPEFTEMAGSEQLGQMQSVGRVLEKLLAGLIPVRARVTDYLAVEASGNEWLVHRRVLDKLQLGSDFVVRPIYLVGIAEEALFWKDIRRVLFSRSRYRVLCRLARPGVQNSWTPVKLAEVFQEVAPNVAGSFEFANQAAAAIGSTDSAALGNEQKSTILGMAVAEYAHALAARFGQEISDDKLIRQPFVAQANEISSFDVKEYRSLCHEVTRYLEQRFQVSADPAILAELRSAALLSARLISESAGFTPSSPAPQTRPSDSSRFLDAELVAIYW